MASFVTPEVAKQAKSQILDPINGPPGNALSLSIWILIGLFGLINCLYAALWINLGLRVWRKQERLWLVKRIDRSNGRYYLPNGGQMFLFGFSTFSLMYLGVLIEMALRRRDNQAPHTVAHILQGIYPAVLAAAAWPTIVSQIMGAAFALEARSANFAKRLPRPLILNIWTWGYFLVLFAIFLGFGIGYTAAAAPFFGNLSKALSLLDKAIAGTFNDQDFAQLLHIQGVIADKNEVFTAAYTRWTWAVIAFGMVVVAMYLPCAIALLYQLHASRRALKQHAVAVISTKGSSQKLGTGQSVPSARFSRTLQFRRENYDPIQHLAIRVTLIVCYACSVVPVALVLIVASRGHGPGYAFAMTGGVVIGYLHAAFGLCFASASLIQAVLDTGVPAKSLRSTSAGLQMSGASVSGVKSQTEDDGEIQNVPVMNIAVHREVEIAIDKLEFSDYNLYLNTTN